jgi:hypothetical protein
VIVAVRDPTPQLLRALEQAIKGETMMVVAPAGRLEQLIAEAYGTASVDEFDIDIDVSADPPPPSRVTRGPMPTPPQPFPRVEPSPAASWHGETPAPLPPLPDMDALDPESIRLSLTDLDDVRVTKDPAQSGQIRVGGTLPPSNKPITTPPLNKPSALAAASNAAITVRPSTPSSPPANVAIGTDLPRRTLELELDDDLLGPAGAGPSATPPPPPPPATQSPAAYAKTLPNLAGRPMTPITLESLSERLADATTREAATDLVLSYVATRWSAGLVLAIRDKTASGYRGHGVEAPETVTVSLGSPSTVQRAVQTRFVSIESPSGVGQSALTHALKGTRVPAAAPVVVNGHPVAVIAVSDPLEGPHARDMAAADLAQCAEALGSAYKRIMSR